MSLSFSQTVKLELLKQVQTLNQAEQEYFLAFCLLAAAKDSPRLELASKDSKLIDLLLSFRPQLFSESPELLIKEAESLVLKESRIVLLLQAAFLACGSMNKPETAYRVEFAPLREIAANLIFLACQKLELSPRLAKRQEVSLVYIQDSQGLADFLLHIKVHNLYLDLESLRVDKEFNSKINRIVNCDRANANKIADSSALQRYYIDLVDEKIGLDKIDPKLAELARLRRSYPELSLGEIGELSEANLSKSGVYHRLRAIRELAEGLADD